MSRIVIAYNTSWYVWNFRMPLAAALRERGHEVIVLAPRDDFTGRLEAAGLGFRDLRLSAKGRNPFAELGAFWSVLRAYRELKPDVVLQYTVKPNLYGSIAARMLGLPVIANVTGLGRSFERPGLLSVLVAAMYRFAFAKVARVFFQNPDDYRYFLDQGLVKEGQCDLLPGSGVDLERFKPRPRGDGPFTFLFVGRLLAAKGVGELLDAARIVRVSLPDLRIALLGEHDERDVEYIDASRLREAKARGDAVVLGRVDDVRSVIASSDVVVLPSYYREGTPRSLLEAAAMGKPLIAADSVGTREPVVEGVNGYRCKPRDAEDLARAMLAMARLGDQERAKFGRESRRIASERFDERIVIGKYIEQIDRLCHAAQDPERAGTA